MDWWLYWWTCYRSQWFKKCNSFVCLYVYRVEYLEKSKHLQDQLRELRSEIEVLKVGEKQSELDHLHDEQVRLGETKYSTLRKVSVFPCLWPCEQICNFSATFKSVTDSSAQFLILRHIRKDPKICSVCRWSPALRKLVLPSSRSSEPAQDLPWCLIMRDDSLKVTST